MTRALNPDTVVIAPAHRNDPLVCEHCGLVSWNKAPGLRRAYEALLARGTATTGEVAEACDFSVSNTTDRIKRLCRLGLVALHTSENHPTGGRLNTYATVDPSAPVKKARRGKGRAA